MKSQSTGLLTTEEIQQFKAITLKTKGVKLSNEEAGDQGARLVRLFELLCRTELVKLA